jgi:hypothetical protein
MDKISVDKHPEMVALMMPGEDVNAFVKLAPGTDPQFLHFLFGVVRNARAAGRGARRSITIDGLQTVQRKRCSVGSTTTSSGPATTAKCATSRATSWYPAL